MEQPSRADRGALGDPLGPLYTWWQGDPLPSLPPPLAGWAAQPSEDVHLLGMMSGLDEEEVRERTRSLNRAYIAFLGEDAVAYGWSAAAQVSIGALGLTFSVPPANRWLWVFATL